MECISKKRVRTQNFTEDERTTFSNLLPKYASMIENKQTDSSTRREKAAAWTALTNEFNSLSSFVHRSEENLKFLWDNMKRKAKKAKGEERKETYKTGGGSRDPSVGPTAIDEKVLEVIGPAGIGLSNGYDGDSEQMQYIEIVNAEIHNGSDTDVGAVAEVEERPPQNLLVEENAATWESGAFTPKMLESRKHPSLSVRPHIQKNKRDTLGCTAKTKLLREQIAVALATREAIAEDNRRKTEAAEREKVLFELQVEKLKLEVELLKSRLLKGNPIV